MALKYFLNDSHQFVIQDYHQGTPFASFLPGIAGIAGIPIWVYYVNRGQGISGFGVENKDQPLLEFSPANMAYKRTELEGFRTFIKVNGKVVEAFSSSTKFRKKMMIDFNGLSFEETMESLGIAIKVSYVTLSYTSYPGLLRKVEITNISQSEKSIELIDGLGTLWPYGTDQFFIKNMSNLAVAWFDVFNVENRVPFYQNRTSNSDSALMEKIERGHFSATYNDQNQKCPMIVDSEIVFDQDTALIKPKAFVKKSLATLLLEPQMTNNRLTAAFSAHQTQLNKTYTFYSIYGRVQSLQELQKIESDWSVAFFEQQFTQAKELAHYLKKPVQTHSGNPLYDAYVGQCLIDNTLRGGYPLLLNSNEDHPHVYHVFSRIHGDMEREYNYFSVEPNFYSQGNGSFRDVNQNRRNDVFLEPEAGLFNIKQFYELIQLDGHNPLSIKGSRFQLPLSEIDKILMEFPESKERLSEFLSKPFTPGQLFAKLKSFITNERIEIAFNRILKASQQEHQAVYGTGYWSDHWTYNLDLVENYLAIYPDKLHALLLDSKLRYYQSHMSVLPRQFKWVKLPDGRIRQLEPVYEDKEKITRVGIKKDTMHYVTNEQRQPLFTSLFGKILHLTLMKILALDPMGMGVMMDTEKPGWNDAMNGLPGIFGSGLSETIEIKRNLMFLIESLHQLNKVSIELPILFIQLFNEILDIVSTTVSNIDQTFLRFNHLQNVREKFEENSRFFVPIDHQLLEEKVLKKGLQTLLRFIDLGLTQATKIGDGIMPTYLTFEATSYDLNGHQHPHLHHPCVHINYWKVRALPHFLEAPARLLKTLHGKEAKQLANLVQTSLLYDKKLKLFVTSTPLDEETMDIGRIRVFTPGWLERESTFMHMSYKYLIGLLKSGLYSAYFKALKTHLPIYRDPKQYGRSPLENSSFIATSRNPNTRVHGKGYVARLTGTTAEMLTMHHMMAFGKHPFILNENGQVIFKPHPILPSYFFDENGQFETTLFSTTRIVYIKKDKQSTFDHPFSIQSMIIKEQGKEITLNFNYLPHEFTIKLRNKRLDQIIITLS